MREIYEPESPFTALRALIYLILLTTCQLLLGYGYLDANVLIFMTHYYPACKLHPAPPK